MAIHLQVYTVAKSAPKYVLSQFSSLLDGFGASFIQELSTLRGIEFLTNYNKKTIVFYRLKQFSLNLLGHLEDFLEEEEALKVLMYTKYIQQILNPLETRLVTTCLSQIALYRAGQIDSLDEVGKVLTTLHHVEDLFPERKFYSDLVDILLIESTRYYGKRNAHKLLSTMSPEYVIHVDGLFSQERDMIDRFLRPAIKPLLEKIFVSIFIEPHAQEYRDMFRPLLKENNVTVLKKLNTILCTIPDVLPSLSRDFYEFMVDITNATLEENKERISSDQAAYTAVIVELYRRYDSITRVALGNAEGFVVARDNGLKSVLNNNVMVSDEINPSARSSELVSVYCDSLLFKSQDNPDKTRFEYHLSTLLMIFSFLDEKDIFQAHYLDLLARRLIARRSVAIESERAFLSGMTTLCGYSWTHKADRMIKDIESSEEITEVFNAKLEKSQVQFPISLFVLSIGYWPMPFCHTVIHLPPQLQEVVDHFKVFFHRQSGTKRKLVWLHNASRGSLSVKLRHKWYMLRVSTFQMIVLLSFNKVDSMSYEDIEEIVGLDATILPEVLQTLVANSVLKTDGQRYKVNRSFKHPKATVQLNVASPIAKEKQVAETHKAEEAERTNLIKSLVVSIMKKQKMMKLNNLISEIKNQVQTRFVIKVKHIKLVIDILVDLGYLERIIERGVIKYRP